MSRKPPPGSPPPAPPRRRWDQFLGAGLFVAGCVALAVTSAKATSARKASADAADALASARGVLADMVKWKNTFASSEERASGIRGDVTVVSEKVRASEAGAKRYAEETRVRTETFAKQLESAKSQWDADAGLRREKSKQDFETILDNGRKSAREAANSAGRAGMSLDAAAANSRHLAGVVAKIEAIQQEVRADRDGVAKQVERTLAIVLQANAQLVELEEMNVRSQAAAAEFAANWRAANRANAESNVRDAWTGADPRVIDIRPAAGGGEILAWGFNPAASLVLAATNSTDPGVMHLGPKVPSWVRRLAAKPPVDGRVVPHYAVFDLSGNKPADPLAVPFLSGPLGATFTTSDGFACFDHQCDLKRLKPGGSMSWQPADWVFVSRDLIAGEKPVLVAAGGGRLAVATTAARVLVYDEHTAGKIDSIAIGGVTGCSAVSPDGKLVAVLVNGAAALFEVKTGGRAHLDASARKPTAVAFSRDSKSVAVGYEDGTVCVWETKTARDAKADGAAAGGIFPGQLRREFPVTPGSEFGAVRGLAFTDDGYGGCVVASVADDGVVRFWGVESGAELTSFRYDGATRQPPRGHGPAVLGLAIADGGRWLAVLDDAGEVYIHTPRPRADSNTSAPPELRDIQLSRPARK